MASIVETIETADDRAIAALFAEIRTNLGAHAVITLDKNNIERTTRNRNGRFASCDAHWMPYVIDPFMRDCECDSPECDPDSCPRFVDECCECKRSFTGSGFLCFDGGDVACTDCVTFRTNSDGNRF